MKAKYWLVPALAAGLIAAAPVATGSTRSPNYENRNKTNIEEITKAGAGRNGLEKLLGGVAHAQGTNGGDFYSALVKQAENIGAYKNPDEVIRLLEPHKNDPNNTNADFYNDLALAYYKKDRNNEAITLYQRALTLGDDPITHYNLGVAYYKAGDLDNALRHISISADRRPNHEGSKTWINHIRGLIKK